MDVKKAAPLVSSRDVSGKKMVEFFGGLKQEFKHVSWTPKDELNSYTKIVVGATFLFGMLIYFMDLLIQSTLHGIGFVVKLLGG